MTERVVLAARMRQSWRVLILAALLSALVGVTLSRGLREVVGVSSSPPAAGFHRAFASELRSLAPAARASISAALGAESPAYRFGASASSPAGPVSWSAHEALS
jgi:hypothetical protein